MTRPPNSGPCSPALPPLGTTPNGATSPCAMLSDLQGAYMALVGGQQTAEVRDNNRIIRYHGGNVKELKVLIRTLEAQCPGAIKLFGQPGAVRAGPYTHTPNFHPGLNGPRRY